MADYPSVDQHYPTTRKALSGLKMETADDGTVRGRRLYDSTLYEFMVTHEHISAANKDSIISHFDSNDTATFNFTWSADSNTYSCNYVNEPETIPMPGGYWTVITTLRGR